MRVHRTRIIYAIYAAIAIIMTLSGCGASGEGAAVLLDGVPVQFGWLGPGRSASVPIVVGSPVGDLGGNRFEVFVPDALDGVIVWHAFPAAFDIESVGQIQHSAQRAATADISVGHDRFFAGSVVATSAPVADPLSWDEADASTDQSSTGWAERVLTTGSDSRETPRTSARAERATPDAGCEASLWMDDMSGGARGIVLQRSAESWASGGVGGVFDVWIEDSIRGAAAYLLLRVYASPDVIFTMPDGAEVDLANLPSETMLSGSGEVEFERRGNILAAKRILLDSTSAPTLW